MAFLFVIAVFALLLFFYLRSQDLFVLSIRDGNAKLIRGRIPGPLRVDFLDACRSMRITHCTITAMRSEGGARLHVSGMDDFHAQRLRNIFRLYSLSDLRAAKAPEEGFLLRMLGIAWLAWLFDRSTE
ncbi:MAG: DUF3634 family protein [Myxococcaceae bacterium]